MWRFLFVLLLVVLARSSALQSLPKCNSKCKFCTLKFDLSRCVATRQSTWVLNCRFCRLISILSRNNLTVVCNCLVLSDRCLSDSRLSFPNFECHDSKTILALGSFTGQQYFDIVFAVIGVKQSVI